MPGAGDRIADESLPDQVARRLTEAILAGEYLPGARLPEPEIAARFGVSRGPVREAFHLMAREGLVQFRPRRGVVVTDLTPEQTHEIYEVRAVLFAYACRLATQRATEEELARARKALEALAQAVSRNAPSAAFMQARTNLVMIIYLAAGNMLLIEETERLNRRALLHFAVFDREERRRESVAMWRRVLAAVEARDPQAAAAAAWSMVDASKREVLRLMRIRHASGEGAGEGAG
ncbi:MAG: GntR family transcriptional regulator [Phenylobacterium sp.]|nr:GntR family transcriptional regulator [Phenylobacterium sp.]